MEDFVLVLQLGLPFPLFYPRDPVLVLVLPAAR